MHRHVRFHNKVRAIFVLEPQHLSAVLVGRCGACRVVDYPAVGRRNAVYRVAERGGIIDVFQPPGSEQEERVVAVAFHKARYEQAVVAAAVAHDLHIRNENLNILGIAVLAQFLRGVVKIFPSDEKFRGQRLRVAAVEFAVHDRSRAVRRFAVRTRGLCVDIIVVVAVWVFVPADDVIGRLTRLDNLYVEGRVAAEFVARVPLNILVERLKPEVQALFGEHGGGGKGYAVTCVFHLVLTLPFFLVQNTVDAHKVVCFGEKRLVIVPVIVLALVGANGATDRGYHGEQKPRHRRRGDFGVRAAIDFFARDIFAFFTH